MTAASDPLERVRRICLGLPGAWEKLSHGEPTFWVGKRMFAMLANANNHHGAGRHAVWCNATFGVWVDRRPRWTEVADRLKHAYDLTAAGQRSKRR